MKPLKKKHYDLYGTEAKCEAFTPSVITLLGTHTDYAGGSTLNLTLKDGVTGVSSPRTDRVISLFFIAFDQAPFTLDLEHLDKEEEQAHHTMLIGLIKKLVHEGYDVSRGMDITLRSDIKKESDTGFSSAVLMTILRLLLKQNDLDLNDEKKARYLSHVQREPFGVLATITEPLSMLKSKPLSILYINQKEGKNSPVDFDFDMYSLLVVDSNRAPELSMNTIIKRMEQVKKGYDAINAKRSIDTLCNLDSDTFNQLKMLIDSSPLIKKRVEHVVFENDRTEQALEVISKNEYYLLGDLFTQSHTSLKELMEVSCEELDYIASNLVKKGALGAKMTGMGFGGSVVALFENDALPSEIHMNDFTKRYNKRFHKTLSIKTIKK